MIATANKDRTEFDTGPFSTCYFSVPELYELMKKNFREVKLHGGFPVVKGRAKCKVTSLVKRSAVKFHLIPGGLKGRAYLKRIFMGKLFSLPHEITEGMADYQPPVEIPNEKVNRDFKILYAVAKK